MRIEVREVTNGMYLYCWPVSDYSLFYKLIGKWISQLRRPLCERQIGWNWGSPQSYPWTCKWKMGCLPHLEWERVPADQLCE